MPGYRPLPQSYTGSAAETVRAAESLRRSGDPASAARALEEALEASLAVRPEVPGWLCGRLAVLYRTMGRLEDEVHLLERYVASQTRDEARTRFEARLSKARTLLARRRPKENGALASVRDSLARRRPKARAASSRRATTPALARAPRPEPPYLPAEAGGAIRMAPLSDLFAVSSEDSFDDRIQAALSQYCAVARARAVSLDELVGGLRDARETAMRGPATTPVISERYSRALVLLMTLYCDDLT